MNTIHAAAAALRAGQTTPVDLVEMCLANIDRWEPHVKAWVFVDREGARAEAVRLTEELGRGLHRGPLHGIPLGVKDIFDVFDWPTAAGSKLWANSIARQDASVVKDLRNAGAIFLGKTVTTQYASFDPPVTRNPWDLTRTPGGSSSGSAVAVATGMCLGALGSQTGGSITRPASYCGVAGCKPSYQRHQMNGVVPLAHSLDHPGLIARGVRDLALMLRPWDCGTFFGRRQPVPDYLIDGLERFKHGMILMGRFHDLFDDLAETAVKEAMDQTCAKLSKRDAVIVDLALPASFSEVIARHRIVMAVEAAQFHRARLARHPDDYQPKIRQLLEEGLACSAVEYADCKRHQTSLREQMRSIMANDMVFITPATTSPAPAADTTGNPAFNSPWSYVGLPTVSIPTGQFVDGLPLALQLIGDVSSEDLLLSSALWCEHALNVSPLSPPLPAGA